MATRFFWYPGHTPLGFDLNAHPKTVAMFRSPAQRVISAFHDGKHHIGLGEDEMLKEWDNLTVAGYARHPGISNCMAKMLQGRQCAQTGGGAIDLNLAVERVRRLAFVGLVHRWNDSVCLLHRMYGGRPDRSEFLVFHAHQTSKNPLGNPRSVLREHDESMLDGFVDHADERIFAEAVATFERNMRRHTTCGARV